MNYIEAQYKALLKEIKEKDVSKERDLIELLFFYNELLERSGLMDNPSVISISPEEILELSTYYYSDIDAKISGFDKVEGIRRRTNQDIGSAKLIECADGHIRFIFKMFTSPNNKVLKRVTKELSNGESFYLERQVIETVNDERKHKEYELALESAFALGLAFERGYLDLKEMEEFLSAARETETNEQGLYAIKYFAGKSFANEMFKKDKVGAEIKFLIEGYLTAAALHLYSKEAPIIKTIEPLSGLLDYMDYLEKRS